MSATNYSVLQRVLDNHDWFGWAAEFGVYTGTSLRLISEHMPVIGFDAFRGLPEEWRPGFPKGKFHDEKMLVVGGRQVPTHSMIVPGWFEDTALTFPFPTLDLVHIDCDLYSSTVTALEAVEDYIQAGRTIIVFDEYEGLNQDGSVFDDEKRAFTEWIERRGINASLIDTEGEAYAFIIESMKP